VAIARFKDLVLDAVDGSRLGAVWGNVLGREWHAQDNGDGWLSGPTPQHTIWINQVPEPKTVKNGVHWDVTVTDLQALLDAGATLLRTKDSEIHWHGLADPEGNEFCAFDA
jgi:Glyoxalase-like domain